ncbi:AEC family transporter [Malonomonas rubra]|uniref:AEC family transporter n=1 Tax=Malonomonas rubra TaxID=57040 RepID=UPI0026EE3861|nr:AEC family transporter [Malonomonas rubra]
MAFLIIFQKSVLPLFVIICVALVYQRFFKPDIKEITSLTLTVFAPVFVFDAIVKHNISFEALKLPFVFMLILTGVLLVMSYYVSRLLQLQSNDRISFILSCSMINIGNFGLPLIYFTYGEQAVSYSVVYFVAFNLSLSTIAIYVSSNASGFKPIMLDLLKMPLFHAFFLAMIVVQCAVQLPEFALKSFSLIGQATIPLLIFILGLQLATTRFQAKFLKIIAVAVIIRLLLSPAVTYPLLGVLGVSGLEQKIATLQTSAPSALLPLMYAIKFNRSPDLLASIILATTVLSSISLTGLIQSMG